MNSSNNVNNAAGGGNEVAEKTSLISFKFIEEGRDVKGKDSTRWKKYVINMPASYVINKTDAIIDEKAKDFELKNLSGENSAVARRAAESAKNKARREIGSETISQQLDYAIAMMVQKVIVDEGLIISSPPAIDVTNFDREADLICAVKFFLCPDMAELDYAALKLQILELDISEEDIRRASSMIADAAGAWDDAAEDHKAAVGDQVLIDFEGTIEGEPFEGNSGANMQLVIGEGKLIDDLEAGIVGMAAGEEKVIAVTFPADYHAAEMQGKAAEFKVKLHKIMTSVPVSDEDRAQIEGITAERMAADFSVVARLWTKKKLFDMLDTMVEMEVPSKMIEVDFKALWNDVMPKINKGLASKDEVAKELMNIAKRRVKLGLMLAHISNDNGVKVTDGDVNLALEMEMQRRPGEEEEVRKFYQDRENYEKVKGSVLEEKVVDFILSRASVETVKVTMEEFQQKYAPELQDVPAFLKDM